MNLETSKKVLKIAGIVTILIGLFALIFGVMAVAGGTLVATDSTTTQGSENYQGAVMAMGAGIIFVVTGLLTLAEGVISYFAGKKGTKGLATAALVFAVLSVLNNCSSLINSFNSGSASTIVSTVISLALSLLTGYAAYAVRTNAE